jgi:hypothetical protein
LDSRCGSGKPKKGQQMETCLGIREITNTLMKPEDCDAAKEAFSRDDNPHLGVSFQMCLLLEFGRRIAHNDH